MRSTRFAVVLLAVTSLSCPPAAAEIASDQRVCSSDAADLDTHIAACSRLIDSGNQQGAKLALSYFYRGNSYKAKGEYDRAIADYSGAVLFNPKYVPAFGNRGNAYKAKGDLDRAIADYEQVIRLNPNDAIAYNNRGNAFFFKPKRDINRAMADYDEAIRLDSKYALPYFNRGRAWWERGDVDRAIADQDRAIQLDPNLTAAYAYRGIFYESKGDIERARANFNSTLMSPEKSEFGKWAHDTARTRLAALSPAPPTAQPTGNSRPVLSNSRVALVIGNSSYLAFPKIPNPRNDADDLAMALKALAFDVSLGVDLKRADMEDIFIRFARQARHADTALVFYAGHGIQYQGVNYLAPIDARVADESDLRKLVSLQDVIGDLQGAARVRILIVDACRDNGVIQQLANRLPASRSASFSRGLARIDGADGTLIAFATQPNRVAADGKGRNSPFTQALLHHLSTPGLELRTLMARVRAEVVNGTGGAQRPEVWDSLVGEFAFNVAP